MSIITNFLKLIKPEKNDYVDVEEHISNNYDKIDTWARDLVINDLENGGVDKALSANQGLILDNKDVGIMGGRDGKFPLTAATKGNIYLLESTQKYYICINDYDGIQISVPNANFEELSVYTNRSKLDNLPKIFEYTGDGNTSKTIQLDKEYNYVEVKAINLFNHSDSTKSHYEYSAVVKQGESANLFTTSTTVLTLEGKNLTVYNSVGTISATPSKFTIILNGNGAKYLVFCYKL